MWLHHSNFGPEAVAPGRQETKSPVFASLIEAMGKKATQVVLDLGPARPANLELLSQFRCKLFIEDAHELVEGFTSEPTADETVLKAWLAQWSAGIDDESVDVLLAWDIFNYLTPGLCRIFIDHVTPLLKPGAHLYLLVYSQQEMPALPMEFMTIAADRIECRPLTGETRRCPRFNQTELTKRLRNFSVIKSVLLRNGLQEYLMKRSA